MGGGGGGAAPLKTYPASTVNDAVEKTYMEGPTAPDGSYDPSRVGFGSQRPPRYDGYQDVGNQQQMSPWSPGYMHMGGGALPGSPNAGFLPMAHNQTWGGGYQQQGYPMGYLGPNENPYGSGNWGPYGGMPQFGQGGLYGQQAPPPWWGNPDGQYGGPPEGLPGAGGYQGGFDPYNPTGYATQNNPYGFFNGFDFQNLFKESQEYLTDYNPYRQPEPDPTIPEEAAPPPAPAEATMGPGRFAAYHQMGNSKWLPGKYTVSEGGAPLTREQLAHNASVDQQLEIARIARRRSMQRGEFTSDFW